jgi:hypothetical protein
MKISIDRTAVIQMFWLSEIQGNKVFTRTVAPARGKDGANPLTAAVEATIKFNLSQYN